MKLGFKLETHGQRRHQSSAAKYKDGPKNRKNGPKTDQELNEKQTFKGPIIAKKNRLMATKVKVGLK